jgi:hypothetical protein
MENRIYFKNKRVMKRKIIKTQIGCIVLVLVALFTGCEKEKTLLTENTWFVQEIKIHADSATWYWWEWIHFDAVHLSFMDKEKYVLQAASYCVIDRVKIKKNNKIRFEVLRGVSAESEFAGYCCLLLSSITHYEVGKRSLVLTGDNGERIGCLKVDFPSVAFQ